MNPIETLIALDGLRRELHCQREKIACLEEAARYLSPAGDGIGGSSGPSDRVGKMAGVLSGLADPVEREVLTKRYIAGLSWEVTARKTGYSYRAIQRIKKRAFKKLSYDVI